jgi:hypothetical protein
MRPSSPFVIDDPEKWAQILERHRIKKLTWKIMKEEYKDWVPDFDPSIIRGVDEVQFCEQTSGFFHYQKATVKGCKTEFIAWLKEYWKIFNAETFMSICNNCILALQQYNQENPDTQRPFVNWIPIYGGLIREPPRFSNEQQLQYMERFHIPFPLEPQIPLTEEEQARLQGDDDDCVLPTDARSGL